MTIEAARKMGGSIAGLGNRGAALVEFAFIAPVLLLILLGTAQFGIAMNQYVMLANSVGVGAMQFATSRGSTTPYTDAVNAIKAAGSTLTPANLTITMSVNGTACTTDGTISPPTGCAGALWNNVGTPALVSVTYPCNLNTYIYNFAPNGCNLTSAVTERVQ